MNTEEFSMADLQHDIDQLKDVAKMPFDEPFARAMERLEELEEKYKNDKG